MSSYTKLFSSIITSTIWSEDDKTRIVWITMLALADKNGEVHGSVPGLARIAGVGTEDCRSALVKFLGPDQDSRTKDDEGRRIEEIDGGWHLINHAKYRLMASDADRKEKDAIRQARKRERDKLKSVTRQSRNSHGGVTQESRQNSQAEAEANTEAEAEEDSQPNNPPVPPKGDEITLPEKPPKNRQGENPAKLDEQKPPCTLAQAKSHAPTCRMTEAQAEHWWHTRNSAGWTKGSHGGGAPRKITSWQSDMATSVSWVAEAAAKQSSGQAPRNMDVNGKILPLPPSKKY